MPKPIRVEGKRHVAISLRTGVVLGGAEQGMRDGNGMDDNVDGRLSEVRQEFEENGNGDASRAPSMLDDNGRALEFEALLNATTDGVFKWDMTTNWLEWDERLHHLMGTSADNFSHDISELISRIHRDDIGSVAIALNAHLKKNQPYRSEFRLRRDDGEYIWVSTVGETIRNSDGTPVKLLGAVVNITSTKESANSLRESERSYHTLYEYLPVPVFVIEPGGGIVDANPKACARLGYDREDLLSMNLLSLLLPDRIVEGLSLLAQISEQGSASTNLVLRAKGGAVINTNLTCSKLPDGNWVVSLQEALPTAQAGEPVVQIRALEELDRFAKGLAHQLNNLLTPVMGYAQLGERLATKDKNLTGYLQEIYKAADRAADLPRQLLAFARRQIIRPEVLDLNDVIVRMDMMLRQLVGNDIELRIDYGSDPWDVNVDPGHIQNIVMNIAGNAKDAMPEGGRLDIEIANAILDDAYVEDHPGVAPGEYVSLSLSDTGTGMTEEVKSHIFEPFYTTKEAGNGIGLGLSTTYGMVAQNEGHIEVFSEPDQGATFKVYFPRAR